MNIKYTLIRSNRKTICIQITSSLEIIVRAPKRLSKKTIDQFVTDHQCWITQKLRQQQTYIQNYPEPTAEEASLLKQRAKDYLPGRTAAFSAVMGLTPTAVKITSAKTRLGSCSAKNSICFSWRLMRYPFAAIDYVIVHELAHIQHKNHGPAFYDCIRQILPDYKDRIRLLKE